MSNINFIKMHGLGNDFVIIDTRSGEISLTPQMVQQISNRHKGVGCDQLVVIENSENADCFVRFYNADGSESGACGNASRCVAWLMINETKKDLVSLATSSGIIECKNAGDDIVSVNMGSAKTNWQDIPLAHETNTLNLGIESGELKDAVAISMGNPHAVFFVDNAESVDLAQHGPILENHNIFPERANIGVAQILSSDKIVLRVWERGSGETLACGTGACAAAVAGNLRGLLGKNVTVHLPGGDLQIEIADNNIIMTGPVATSFSGTIS